MSQSPRPVGPRGLTVLAVTAVVGVALAVHGWSARQLPSALGSVSGGRPAASPSHTTAPANPAGPTPSASASGGTPSAGTTAGPLLSSQSYASYAFQVWPGPLSSSAKSAEIGLSITVRRHGTGLEVTAGVNGQPAGAPRFYAGGARVYVIEASLGDDSGNADYNLGDDGLVVTDARGRILQ